MRVTVPLLMLPILPVLAGCQSTPRSVEVSVIDGRQSVLVDGRPFPADRVEVRDMLVLKHPNGRDWISMPLDGGAAEAMRHGGGPVAMPLPQENFPEHWGDQPPPVMLGVLLEPGGEVAKSRGADPARSSHIPDLAEHHPAGRQGLQDGDLIVWFNGQEDASPAAIRAALRTMQPGDQVFFKVLRGDGPEMKQVEATVQVEPFDLGKMVRGGMAGPEGDPFMDLHMRLDRVEGMLQELLRRSERPGPMGGGPGPGPRSGPGAGPGVGPGAGPNR